MTPDDITELFGARCAEFDPDCACCRVWQQQDEIERLQRLVDDNDARSVHTCHDHCQRLECVQRLRTQLAGADLLLRVARDCLHATPTSPWAAETTNRIDAFLAREEKP